MPTDELLGHYAEGVLGNLTVVAKLHRLMLQEDRRRRLVEWRRRRQQGSEGPLQRQGQQQTAGADLVPSAQAGVDEAATAAQYISLRFGGSSSSSKCTPSSACMRDQSMRQVAEAMVMVGQEPCVRTDSPRLSARLRASAPLNVDDPRPEDDAEGDDWEAAEWSPFPARPSSKAASSPEGSSLFGLTGKTAARGRRGRLRGGDAPAPWPGKTSGRVASLSELKAPGASGPKEGLPTASNLATDSPGAEWKKAEWSPFPDRPPARHLLPRCRALFTAMAQGAEAQVAAPTETEYRASRSAAGATRRSGASSTSDGAAATAPGVVSMSPVTTLADAAAGVPSSALRRSQLYRRSTGSIERMELGHELGSY